MRMKIIAAALAAGVAMPAAADDMATVLAEMKRLSARVEALEKQNKDLEKALASERISEKDPELATRVKAVETQVDAIKGPATKLAEALDGIEVEGSITAVVQKVGGGGTASGRDETRGNYRGDLTISLPVGSMGDSDGKFFTHVRLGQGDGVGLRPTYTSGPNTAAFQGAAGSDDTYGIVAQAWYQLTTPLGYDARKEDARDHLILTVGKIDPFVFFDQNAAADDETAKFMNNAFVHNPLLDSGGDIGADKYGFQPGAIVKYENSHEKGGEWALSLGAFASDSGADFSGSWSDPFVIGQIETNARFNFLPGTYRAYAWSNGQAQNYDATQRRNSGWGVSADQKVLEDLTLFGRYGHHTAGKVSFDRALTLGAELDGTPWRRSADAVGFAYGRLETSAEFRRDSLAVAGYRASGSEYQSELYYRFKLNDAVELSPSYQWIRNPGGNDRADTVKVAGLRARLGF
jgi:high affinity Mn2+ porin